MGRRTKPLHHEVVPDEEGLTPAFAFGLYSIRDASWRPAYREVVDRLVAKHGGRYVARTTNPWEVLEGAAPDITGITMIEFPSMAHARACYNDPEYAPMKRLRHARYFTLQLAESYLTGALFRQILQRVERLGWHPT